TGPSTPQQNVQFPPAGDAGPRTRSPEPTRPLPPAPRVARPCRRPRAPPPPPPPPPTPPSPPPPPAPPPPPPRPPTPRTPPPPHHGPSTPQQNVQSPPAGHAGPRTLQPQAGPARHPSRPTRLRAADSVRPRRHTTPPSLLHHPPVSPVGGLPPQGSIPHPTPD